MRSLTPAHNALSGLSSLTLEDILTHAPVWRGQGGCLGEPPGLATGFSVLDAALPGGGWPAGGITEIFSTQEGVGEVSLTLPAISRLADQKRGIAWVMPARSKTSSPRRGTGQYELARIAPSDPHRLPFAPALFQAGIPLDEVWVIEPANEHDAVWALTQLINANHFGAVLGWLYSADTHSLRRLQIAAEKSSSTVWLFRPGRLAHQHSPARLKLLISPPVAPSRWMHTPSQALEIQIVEVRVLKRRGLPLENALLISLPSPTQRSR